MHTHTNSAHIHIHTARANHPFWILFVTEIMRRFSVKNGPFRRRRRRRLWLCVCDRMRTGGWAGQRATTIFCIYFWLHRPKTDFIVLMGLSETFCHCVNAQMCVDRCLPPRDATTSTEGTRVPKPDTHTHTLTSNWETYNDFGTKKHEEIQTCLEFSWSDALLLRMLPLLLLHNCRMLFLFWHFHLWLYLCEIKITKTMPFKHFQS